MAAPPLPPHPFLRSFETSESDCASEGWLRRRFHQSSAEGGGQCCSWLRRCRKGGEWRWGEEGNLDEMELCGRHPEELFGLASTSHNT